MLRAQLASALGGRVATPFTDLGQRVSESISSGIPSLDTLTGGLPRGAITEIYGRASSGKTSLLLSILAAATAREETCALVDGSDTFAPSSGIETGIELKRLLWVRCHHLDHSLKSVDLLLQSGGFGIVAMDLSDIPIASVQSVPLATWFRFQRSIEKTPTILALVSEAGVAKTCASLAIETTGSSFRFRVSEFGFEMDAAVNRSRRQTPRFPHVRIDLHSPFSSPGARP